MIQNVANSQEVKNYFSLPKVQLEGVEYNLVWSSHPTDNYYKHEYLATGETVDEYKTMVMVDFIKSDDIDLAVGAHTRSLDERKKTDIGCRYALQKHPVTGEYMLDCILNEVVDGKIKTAEWDVYRYKKTNGGIMVFSLSKRAYWNDVRQFLTDLKENRITWLNLIGNIDLPTITVNN